MALDIIATQQYASTILANTNAPTAGSLKPGTGTKGVRKSVFQSLFEKEQTSEEIALQELTEIVGLDDAAAIVVLKDRLDESGERLKERGATEDFAAYKTAVQHFVKFVVTKNFTVEQSAGDPRYKKNKDGSLARDGEGKLVKESKIYVRITVIDKKLDQLAAEVLVNHQDKISILAKINEINGLVVNLLR
jgi:uncharacterized protein YaaR (DUF327 family)